MLNEDRIRLMVRLAEFEQDHGREKIKAATTYRKDYVGFKLLTGALWVIAGYLLLLAFVCVGLFSEILASLSMKRLLLWGILAAVCFVLLLVLYLVLLGRHYAKKHRAAVKETKQYYELLSRLWRLYEKEEKSGMVKKTLVDWEESE